MRYLVVPLVIFMLSFLVLEFAKRLQLDKCKTWMGIGRQIVLAVVAATITNLIVYCVVVFFN